MSDTHGALPALIDTRHVASLAVDASALKQFSILTEGLGEGLPATVPLLWDPKHGQVVSVYTEIERFRLHPRRRKGTATALTLESFCELVNRHSDLHSAIFADTDWRAPGFTAVINYHESVPDGDADDSDAQARHGDHRIAYAFPLTEEWQAWIAANGERMPQDDFAAFLEERIAELATPSEDERREFEPLFGTKFATPAELVQLSRGLQVHVGQKIKNSRILQSGEAEVVFEETHTDASGERLVVPGLFMLSVPVFVRGQSVRIPVRLRYRAHGGAISWFFQMYRPDIVITGRVLEDLAKAAEATGLPAYEGQPES
ncbi:DUF2303 family protein [Amorphus sp. 3PC139-8]|uniref:DUF2303 family protein n=1 Tax=Amorphus sp. 3PC139-8 TaxID=2735676 RepID=UPI00345CE851